MELNKIQVIIFKKIGNNINYILLKRIHEKGGFWQPISGDLKKLKSLGVKRELEEEMGVNAL